MLRPLAALLLLTAPLAAQPTGPEASIVKVQLMNRDQVLVSRSGLVVSRGYVVTTLDDLPKAKSVQVKVAGAEPVQALGVAAYNRHAGLALLKVNWEGKTPPAANLAESPPAKGIKIKMVGAGTGTETLEVQDIADAVGFSFGSSTRDEPSLQGRALIDGDRIVGIAIGGHLKSSTSKDPDARAPGPCLDAARVELIRALEPSEAITWSKWPALAKEIDRSERIITRGLGALQPAVAKAETIKHFKSATDADPMNWNAWIELAAAYRADNQDTEAITAAENAIRLGPTSDTAFRIRSLILSKKGESADAIAAARQAIKLAPKSKGNHYALGAALMSGRDYDKAIDAFKEELRQFPTNSEAREGLKSAEEWKSLNPK